jgi:hypothetical protein
MGILLGLFDIANFRIPCSIRDFITEPSKVSPASSQDQSEPMRKIAFSRATHDRLYGIPYTIIMTIYRNRHGALHPSFCTS